MAKNCLHNVNGFSPYQLVYGRNPNLPSVLTNKPPALEGTTISKYVTNYMEALHVSREEFVKAESSERTRRALRRQIRPSGTTYDTGNLVYYKRNDSDKWKGPGHVIGQDGQQVFVRHGGTHIRIHPCCLMKCSDADNSAADLTIKETTGQDSEKDVAVDARIHEPDSDDSLTEETFSDSSQLAPVDTTDLCDNASDLNPELSRANEVSARNDNIDTLSNDAATCYPKIHHVVRFNKMSDDDDHTWYEAGVLSRAGKATGKYKNCFNICFKCPPDIAGETGYIDFNSDVKKWNLVATQQNQGDHQNEKRVESSVTSEGAVVYNSEKSAVDRYAKAKVLELDNWNSHDVFEEVPDYGQKALTTCWVCTSKTVGSKTGFKARLVARGFEEQNLTEIERDSPTCSRESQRLVLAIVAIKSWKIRSAYIKTAFVKGERLDRHVYLKPPVEANSKGKLWKLNKCVYGLCDASRHWYLKVHDIMIQHGAQVSNLDRANFIGKKKIVYMDC